MVTAGPLPAEAASADMSWKAVDRYSKDYAGMQAQNGVKLTFLPFIAKAVAEALKQHPKLNAAYDEDKQEITYHNAEHLAMREHAWQAGQALYESVGAVRTIRTWGMVASRTMRTPVLSVCSLMLSAAFSIRAPPSPNIVSS